MVDEEGAILISDYAEEENFTTKISVERAQAVDHRMASVAFAVTAEVRHTGIVASNYFHVAASLNPPYGSDESILRPFIGFYKVPASITTFEGISNFMVEHGEATSFIMYVGANYQPGHYVWGGHHHVAADGASGGAGGLSSEHEWIYADPIFAPMLGTASELNRALASKGAKVLTAPIREVFLFRFPSLGAPGRSACVALAFERTLAHVRAAYEGLGIKELVPLFAQASTAAAPGAAAESVSGGTVSRGSGSDVGVSLSANSADVGGGSNPDASGDRNRRGKRARSGVAYSPPPP